MPSVQSNFQSILGLYETFDVLFSIKNRVHLKKYIYCYKSTFFCSILNLKCIKFLNCIKRQKLNAIILLEKHNLLIPSNTPLESKCFCICLLNNILY